MFLVSMEAIDGFDTLLEWCCRLREAMMFLTSKRETTKDMEIERERRYPRTNWERKIKYDKKKLKITKKYQPLISKPSYLTNKN